MDYAFFSIINFRNSINQLCKNDRDGYKNCKFDIYHIFKNRNFDEIWIQNPKLKEDRDIKVIKLRVPNSSLKLSKADGYRLIIGCNRKNKTINFLNIYPKRGKHSKLDQSPEETSRQLKEYLESFKLCQLVEHENSPDLTPL